MTTDDAMNDTTDSLDLDLSLSLDGVASPEIEARLQSDHATLARREQMRRAIELIASPPSPLDDQAVNSTISAALDGARRNVSADPGVVSMLPSPGSTGSRRIPPWLVAAAVLILMGVGLTLVYTGRETSTDVAFQQVGSSLEPDTALTESADADNTAEREAAAAGAAAPDAADAVSTTSAVSSAGGTSVPTLVPLGSFESADQLREHLRSGFPEAPPDVTNAEHDLDAAFRCLGKIDTMFGTGSEPVHVGLATIAGDRTVVYELPYKATDGRQTTLVVAVGELSCIPALSFQR